jgi:soluble lytic murein transglycosylase
MTKLKRPVAILIILAVSFLSAWGLDALASLLEKQMHPTDFEEYVNKYSAEYNVPTYVIFAVIDVESNFKPYSTSDAGARGLMQMLPSTFEWLTSAEHLGEDLSADELYEPEVNIRYGTYYLSYLFEKFHDWDTVFAAYNAGEGNVAEWLEDDEYSSGGKLTHIPFKETRAHVKKVNKAIDYYKNTYYRNEENTQ